MARKLPKNFDKKIMDRLLEVSGTRRELNEGLREIIQEHQDNAEASTVIREQANKIRSQKSSAAQKLGRLATAPNTSFDQRIAAAEQFESISTFSPSGLHQSVAAAQAQMAEARRTAKEIQSGNLPPTYRSGLIASYEKINENFSSPLQNQQVQEIKRRLSENQMRGELRKASLEEDPEAYIEKARGVMGRYQGVLDSNSRYMVETERRISRAQKKIAGEVDQSTASDLRGKLGDFGSARERIEFLGSMRTEEQGSKTLKEIERLTKEQNLLIKQDVQNFEKAQQQFPILSRMMFGGGGGDGPGGNGPGTMTPGNFQKVQAASMAAKGVAAGVAGGFSLGKEFFRSGMYAEGDSFVTSAQVAAARERQNLETLTNVNSGQGLLRAFGDVLLEPGQSTFQGPGGIRRARALGLRDASEQRQLENLNAIGSGAGLIGSLGAGLAIAAGGAKIGAGVGTLAGPLGTVLGGVAGAGVAVAGAAGFGGSIFNNRSLQELGLFGRERQQRAVAERARFAESRSQNYTESELGAMQGRTRGLDQAIAIRAAEMQSITALGADPFSFRGQLSSAFAPFASRDRSGEDFLSLVASSTTALPGFAARAAQLGVGPEQLMERGTGFGLATDSRYRGNRLQDTIRLRELEISGRGSGQALTGNIQALSRFGAADPTKELEGIFSRAVESGMKNARLSQEFAQAVFQGMEAFRTTDSSDVATRLTTVSSLFGGGSRGLQAATGSVSAMARLGSNPLLSSMRNIRFLGSTRGLGDLQASAADIMGRLDSGQRFSALNQIERVMGASGDNRSDLLNQLDPTTRQLYSIFSGRGSINMVQGARRAEIESMFTQYEGGLDGFRETFKSEIDSAGGLTRDNFLDVFNRATAGAPQLKGMESSSYLPILNEVLPEYKNFFSQQQQDRAVNKPALGRFININRLKERQLRMNFGMGGAGENALSRSIIGDLTGPFGSSKRLLQNFRPTGEQSAMQRMFNPGGRPGMSQSLTEIMSANGMDLSRLGDLGTGLGSERVNEMLGNRMLSAEIMEASSALETGNLEQFGEASSDVRAVASAFRQDRLGMLDLKEADRLGIDQMSMVKIAPSSIRELAVAIGETKLARPGSESGPTSRGSRGTR